MSLGEALVTTRRARAMTQQDLAEAAGVTQAALSRYENDLRDPSQGTLESLATALGVTPEFLQLPTRARGAFMVDAHMRRRPVAKPTVWRRLEARLNVYRMHVEFLLREVEIEPHLILPLFDPLEYSASDAARLTRMQWRMPSGPVRDLIGWLESVGCVVIAEDFGSMTGGGRIDGLSQWVSDAPVMLVNSRASTDRLRLTLAHELAHICLHSDQLGGDPEQEANDFAAEFLMPADLIRPELRNLNISKLHSLKRYWGVSMQALIERGYRLETISASQRASFYKTLSARGWRAKEPLSDELPLERPQLAQRLGQVLIERGLTTDEVAGIAGAAPGHEHLFFLPKPRLTVV